MGLETATFVADLVVSNPDGAADQKQQGDNHLRLIKTVLKNTFPGFTGRIGRVQTKGGNYTAVGDDNFSVLFFTAGATLSLTAAATLGNGWATFIYASGGDVIVDPSGSEEVNGALTKTVKQGQMAAVFCSNTGGDEFFMLYSPSNAEIQALIDASVSAVWTTGDVKVTYKTSADTGWVMMNDGSIGNAASGATTRANADTLALFTLLWNNTTQSECPVSTGRGGSAAADFASNKNIALPKVLGRELAIAGAGSGLTSRLLASILGTETKTIGTTHLPASGLGIPSLTVTGSAIPNAAMSSSPVGGAGTFYIPTTAEGGGFGITWSLSGSTSPTNTSNMGSGNALDVMTPRTHANVMIRL